VLKCFLQAHWLVKTAILNTLRVSFGHIILSARWIHSFLKALDLVGKQHCLGIDRPGIYFSLPKMALFMNLFLEILSRLFIFFWPYSHFQYFSTTWHLSPDFLGVCCWWIAAVSVLGSYQNLSVAKCSIDVLFRKKQKCS
jgi:hypothetical protein